MRYEPSLMRLLRCFTNADVRRFTDLAKELSMDTDLAGYYLRKLQSRELVSNIDRGKYQITALGKSTLAHHKQLADLRTVPRVSVLLVLAAKEGYVVTQRLKQPFLDKLEWPVASLGLGEPMQAAVERLATERLGVTTQPKYRGLFRCVDKYSGVTFDDKFFAVHTAKIASATQLALDHNDVGRILALPLAALEAHPNRIRNLLDILRFALGRSPYREMVYTLEKADIFGS